ncbi:MAG: helix-turn-helix transcriptional regulator [Candidatus Heimdallarchaeota archaeon]|nr:helix-turn-helix transcriptional regulator [Candidatus Heimdallarchaeota archaeon]
MSIRENIKHCPVEVAMKVLGKKWTIHILRDMFRGVTKFSDFLTLSPKMSTRVLSQRLKELQIDGMIERVVLNETPIHIEYHLTDKGIAFHAIILAISKFSINEYPERIFADITVTPLITKQAVQIAEQRFSVISGPEDYR